MSTTFRNAPRRPDGKATPVYVYGSLSSPAKAATASPATPPTPPPAKPQSEPQTPQTTPAEMAALETESAELQRQNQRLRKTLRVRTLNRQAQLPDNLSKLAASMAQSAGPNAKRRHVQDSLKAGGRRLQLGDNFAKIAAGIKLRAPK